MTLVKDIYFKSEGAHYRWRIKNSKHLGYVVYLQRKYKFLYLSVSSLIFDTMDEITKQLDHWHKTTDSITLL